VREGRVNLPLVNGNYRKSGRVLAGLLGSMALAIWLFHFYLWYQYDGTRPLRPDASSGRLYPLNTHGHFVYLNKQEVARLTALTVLTFGLFGTAILIDVLFVARRTNPWEKKQW
jgi:hypothetical protein